MAADKERACPVTCEIRFIIADVGGGVNRTGVRGKVGMMRLRFIGTHGSGPVNVMAKNEVDGKIVWADVYWKPSNDYVADVPDWLGEHLLKKSGDWFERIEGELEPLPVAPTGREWGAMGHELSQILEV
jgi:hypothetical protein